MPTMGDEITNQVFFNDVFVADEYLVGERGRGFQYISEALDLERFTMFTFSPIEQRLEELVDYVKQARRDDSELRRDPIVREKLAWLATRCEVARVLGLRFVSASMKGGKPPTCEASEYKLFATGLSQRLANAALDVAGSGGQLRCHAHAPERRHNQDHARCVPHGKPLLRFLSADQGRAHPMTPSKRGQPRLDFGVRTDYKGPRR